MAATSRTKLTLALLDNGIDFLRKAVEELHPHSTCACDPFSCPDHISPKTDPAGPKYALMHAYAGILLLLKEKLRRLNPALLMQPKSYNANATVDYTTLFKRLQASGYLIPPSAKTMLDAVRDLRNPFEHYEVEVDAEDGEKMVASMVEFAYHFMADELQVRMEDRVSHWVWLHVQELHSVAIRVEAEMAADEAAWWNHMLSKYSNLSDEELEELADLEPYHPKNNPDPDEFHWCPQCSEWTVVLTKERVGVCTNKECRESYRTDACKRCGETLIDEEGFCEVCSDDIFGDD